MSAAPPARDQASARPMTRSVAIVVGAIAFMVFYMVIDVVSNAVATEARPAPDPAGQVFHDIVDIVENPPVPVLTGLLGLASVTGILVFVMNSQRGQRTGLFAAGSLTVSALLGFLLVVTPSTLPGNLVNLIRTAGFVAGGVGYVVSLGVYMLLTHREQLSCGPRVFGAVATVPALLSMTSLGWYYGNAFIVVGRILCLLWVLAAAVALIRACGETAGRPSVHSATDTHRAALERGEQCMANVEISSHR